MNPRTFRFIIFLFLFPIVVFIGLKGGEYIYREKPPTVDVDWISTMKAGDLTLTDHSGKPFRFSNFGKDYLIVFFGYTHCPDVCPTGLTALVSVMQKLGEDSKRLQVVFVSLDPGRDTLENLKEYLGHFDKDFLGVTGTEKEIKTVASRFGIQYERKKQESKDGNNYQIDHKLMYFLINSKGDFSGFFAYSDGPKKMTEQIRNILKKNTKEGFTR